MSAAIVPLPREGQQHWTVEEFYAALEVGAFTYPERLELIHGRIIEKMPQSPLHRSCRMEVSRRLSASLGLRLDVVEEYPIHIAFDGEPIPDVAVLRLGAAEYRESHPSPEEAALLVEIAVSSVEYDLGEKAFLYALAGAAEYWVMVLDGQAVVVHRGATPGGYQSVARLGPDARLSPLAAPDVAFAVRSLLTREED